MDNIFFEKYGKDVNEWKGRILRSYYTFHSLMPPLRRSRHRTGLTFGPCGPACSAAGNELRTRRIVVRERSV